MRCPFCNKENPDSARFCGGCGSPLPYYQKAGTWGNGPVYDDTRGNKTPERGPYGGNISAENPGRSLPPGIDPNQNRASKKSPGKKKWIFIGAGAAAAVIVVIVVVLIFAGRGSVSEVEETQDEEYLEAAENYGEVNASLIEIAESLEDEDMTTDEKAQLYLDTLEELEEEGLIQESSVVYDESISEISYNYADGAAGGILLEEIEEGTSGYGTDSYITSYNDDGYAATVTSDPVSFDIEGYPYEEEELSGFAVWGLGEGYEDELEVMEGSVINWNKANLTTQIDYDFTLEEMRTALSGYDFVVIQLHGYAGCGYPVLDEAVSWADAAFYTSDEAIDLLLTEEEIATIEDLQSGRVEMKLTSLNGWSTFNYIICPDFFTYYYGDNGLEDTIVWLGCCEGYLYDDLVNSVYDCGAGAVLACTESVITYYNIFCLDAFVYSLLYGNTVDESLSLAKSAWGENDSIFHAQYSSGRDDYEEDTTPSEIRYCEGSADATLVTLTQEALASLEADGTAVMYQLYYDKLMELQDEYGETVTKESDIYGSWLEGLCFASLIDFDNDNTEELILAYGSSDESEESLDLDYIVEVWEYSDDTISKIFDSTNYENADSWDAIRVSCVDGKYYIFTEIDDVYSAENDAESSQYFYVWGYDENEFTQIEKLEADFYWDSTIYFVNGSEMTEDEYYDEYSGWWEDYVEYRLYMGSLTAEGELENTLSYLMEYPGISAE